MPNACCCGSTPPPACQKCFGTAPNAIQATFSGLTLCSTACRPPSGFGAFDEAIVSGSSPNGTFFLTALTAVGPDTCRYRAVIPVPIVVAIYSSTDGSCSGSILGTYSVQYVDVEYTKIATTYSIRVEIFTDSGFVGTSYSAFRYFVSAVNTNYCVDGSYGSQISTCVSGQIALTRSTTCTGGAVTLAMVP